MFKLETIKSLIILNSTISFILFLGYIGNKNNCEFTYAFSRFNFQKWKCINYDE